MILIKNIDVEYIPGTTNSVKIQHITDISDGYTTNIDTEIVTGYQYNQNLMISHSALDNIKLLPENSDFVNIQNRPDTKDVVVSLLHSIGFSNRAADAIGISMKEFERLRDEESELVQSLTKSEKRLRNVTTKYESLKDSLIEATFMQRLKYLLGVIDMVGHKD